jgi:hypothetical protein
MSLDAVVSELSRVIDLYGLGRYAPLGISKKIGNCCGSRVLTDKETNAISLEYTVPYGLQFYIDRLDPPDPKSQFLNWTSTLKYPAIKNLKQHSWHYQVVNLPEINCSYTIVIADTFNEEDEDDEDCLDDEED